MYETRAQAKRAALKKQRSLAAKQQALRKELLRRQQPRPKLDLSTLPDNWITQGSRVAGTAGGPGFAIKGSSRPRGPGIAKIQTTSKPVPLTATAQAVAQRIRIANTKLKDEQEDTRSAWGIIDKPKKGVKT